MKKFIIFQEEIAKRLENGIDSTITFLIREGFLKYLPPEYLKDLMDELDYKGLEDLTEQGYDVPSATTDRILIETLEKGEEEPLRFLVEKGW